MQPILRIMLTVFAAYLLAPHVAAQETRFGVKAGLAFSRMSFAPGTRLDAPQDHRVGPDAAVFAVVAVSKRIALQPELRYVEKGFQSRFAGGVGGVEMGYIEMPLLARITPWLNPASRVRPILLAGATIAREVSCTAVGDFPEIEYSTKCSDIGPPGGRTPSSFEVGAAAGLGLELDAVGGVVLLDVRYTHGLTSAASDLDEWNRVWSASIGYSIAVTPE
jgi:hypothetical protein